MMRPVGEVQVYLHRAPIDMASGPQRPGGDRSVGHTGGPIRGGLFLFVGKRLMR